MGGKKDKKKGAKTQDSEPTMDETTQPETQNQPEPTPQPEAEQPSPVEHKPEAKPDVSDSHLETTTDATTEAEIAPKQDGNTEAGDVSVEPSNQSGAEPQDHSSSLGPVDSSQLGYESFVDVSKIAGQRHPEDEAPAKVTATEDAPVEHTHQPAETHTKAPAASGNGLPEPTLTDSEVFPQTQTSEVPQTPETPATSQVHNEQEKQGSTSQITDSGYQHIEEPAPHVTTPTPTQEAPVTAHATPVETKPTAPVAAPEPEQTKTPVKEQHTPKQAAEPVPEKPTHQPEPARVQTPAVAKPETPTPAPPVVQTPAETKDAAETQLPGKKEPTQPVVAPESPIAPGAGNIEHKPDRKKTEPTESSGNGLLWGLGLAAVALIGFVVFKTVVRR